ncbi:MAG: hypothetical protein AVDCRST_MAG96-3158, partial [uncultured Segetibacter sp.]
CSSFKKKLSLFSALGRCRDGNFSCVKKELLCMPKQPQQIETV